MNSRYLLVYDSHRLRVIEAIELVALDVFNARRSWISARTI